MSIAIREAEGKRDRAGLFVRELENALAMALAQGWDTVDDLKAQITAAKQMTGAASRAHDVAFYKEHGRGQGTDSDNMPARIKHAGETVTINSGAGDKTITMPAVDSFAKPANDA